MSRTYRRVNYLPKRKLQVKYALVLLVSMLVAAGAAGALLYFDTWGALIPEFSEARMAEKLEQTRRLQDYEQTRTAPRSSAIRLFKEAQRLSAHEQMVLSDSMEAAQWRVIPRLLVIFLAFGVASIFLSHKLAGPIYRFERSVELVAKGKLNASFKLRKGDELWELSRALEKLVNSWHKRTQHTAQQLQELERQTGSLLQKIPSGTAQAIAAQTLKHQISSMRHELQHELESQ